jgi:hypothetical protein
MRIKFTELCPTKGRGWFLNFLVTPMILELKKVYLLRLMPVCVGSMIVQCSMAKVDWLDACIALRAVGAV